MLGFLRDLLLARIFGAGVVADAFFVAFRIPNTFRSLVAEGALSSAFIPVAAKEFEQEHHRGARALRDTVGLMLCSTVGLTLLVLWRADLFVGLFAPGFERETSAFELTSDLVRIIFPYLISVTLVTLSNGALNCLGVYGSAPAAQIVVNLTLVAAALLALNLTSDEAVWIMAFGVLFAGIFQVAVQLPFLHRVKLTLLPSRSLFSGTNRQVLWLMIPALLSAAVYQLTILMSTALASLLPAGSIAWLFYADRVSQLPLGIFTVALSSVLLPALSSQEANRSQEGFRIHLLDSLRFTSFVTLPIAVFFFFEAERVIELIFERGAFGERSTEMSALALQAYSLGLWMLSSQTVVSRAFIAKRRPGLPALTGALSLLVYMAIAVCLLGPVQEPDRSWLHAFVFEIQQTLLYFIPLENWGHVGLALASSGAAAMNFFLQLILAVRFYQLDLTPFLKATWRCLLAALTFGASSLIVDQATLPSWLHLLLVLALGKLGYTTVLFLTRSQELQETFSVAARIGRRYGRKSEN